MNKKLYRDRRRCKEYNLTQEELDYLRTTSNNKCQICNKDYEKLCVDHNHENGKVHGLLCHNCNLALGNMRESIDNFQNAIFYLKSHSESNYLSEVLEWGY